MSDFQHTADPATAVIGTPEGNVEVEVGNSDFAHPTEAAPADVSEIVTEEEAVIEEEVKPKKK